MAAAAAEGSSGAAAAPISSSKDNTEKTAKTSVTVSEKDVEKAVGTQVITPVAEIKLSLMDVNPIRPIGLVLRRLNNFVVLFASGAYYYTLHSFLSGPHSHETEQGCSLLMDL
jgi:hypothetical protein